ncbi:MAG: hypothetical protein FGM61_02590 [Sediminibacterium sp.]|nr:hypothetical protein [Sediminibacterium sp.]
MNQQLIEGVHFYYEDGGMMVFTKVYHLEKGYCCGNGCRHCPFDFENVPEPRKSMLKNSQQEMRDAS